MRFRSTLATAALAGTLALAGCGDGSPDDVSAADPSAGDEPTGSAEQDEAADSEIPDDFPLASGMGGPDDTIATSRTGTGLRDLTVCDTAPLRGLGTRDRMIADNSGGESANTRELVLLGSPDEAALVAEAFAGLPASCPSPEVTGDTETFTEVRESAFGPGPATTLLRTYTFDGEPGTGATVIHVVPVGAALLVTSTYGQWAPAELEEGVASTVEPLREAVDALAMFDDGSTPTAEPSDEPSEETSGPGAVIEIPDDFPLLAGWPEDSTAEAGAGNGRQGPSRTSDPLEFRACDERWHEPPYVDRLRADWVNAEDYRTRQLTTYPDAAAAVAAVDDLVAHEQACPTEPAGEDGFGTTRDVRPVTLGGGAWAILERATFDGGPSIFGESALVVRVGRAVLAVRHGGHAGYPSGDGEQQIAAMGSEASDAIAKMCEFTKTGC